jgi:ribonuclease BN (tRNA processing enzyme)
VGELDGGADGAVGVGPGRDRRDAPPVGPDFYEDQARWAVELGFDPAGWSDTVVRDIAPGWSMELGGCTITAAAVVHPPVAALGFRFDHAGRSLVISGDTAACPELVELSRGADLLVADACAAPPPATAPPARRALIERLRVFHASPQECLDMAGRAGVGTVVLTHHLPDADPVVDTSTFAGRTVIGVDQATYLA